MADERAKGLGLNALDRAIAVFAPQAALGRVKARAQLAVVEAFTASSVGKRSMLGWATSGGSADVDSLPGLALQRQRSRDLVRNAPIAAGAIASTVTSVVGTGLSLQSQIDAKALGMTPEQGAELQRQIEREWRLWADTTDCDITRHQDFYGLQDLVFRSVLENGDAFTVLPFVARRGSSYDLRVQLVEADRVSNPSFEGNSETMAAGVEMDETGAPIAYHILRKHPGGWSPGANDWQRFAAFGGRTGRRNVLHHFHRKRIGQNRGYPWLSAVVEPLKQLDRYAEAEVQAAVVAGLLSVFVTTEGGVGFNMGASGIAGEVGASPTDKDVKLASGAIIDLAPGEKVETVTPGRPSPNFDPFFQAFLRQIGMGLEIPFEVLIKHFQSSYSAARGALVEAWKFYMVRRSWLIQSFCQPVYEAWLEEAVASGRIDAPGFFADPAVRRAYCGAQWHGDVMPQLDPEKEVNASKARIDARLSNHAREAAQLLGTDWETDNTRLAGELDQMRENGTMPEPAAAPFGAPAPKGETEDDPEDPKKKPAGTELDEDEEDGK